MGNAEVFLCHRHVPNCGIMSESSCGWLGEFALECERACRVDCPADRQCSEGQDTPKVESLPPQFLKSDSLHLR